MKLKQQTHCLLDLPKLPNLPNLHETFLFDIETTGLCAKTSYVYLIGVLFWEKGYWHSCQWLAQNAAEESEILRRFLDFCSSFRQVVHFNGRRFDLPFLLERCRQLSILCPLTSLSQFDLFQEIRPFKRLLNLEKLNQPYLESFLGVRRICPYTGKDLISLYRQCQGTLLPQSEELLFAHNLDDLTGMVSLFSFLSYEFLQKGIFSLESVSAKQCPDQAGAFCLEVCVLLPYPIPAPVSLHNAYGFFCAEKERALFVIEGAKGTMRHFFSDYKHYDYLPLEGRAVHKSLSSCIERSRRRPAKPEECYVEKTGLFLPQKTSLYTPCFQESCGDSRIYFAYEENMFSDSSVFSSYIQSLFLQ